MAGAFIFPNKIGGDEGPAFLCFRNNVNETLRYLCAIFHKVGNFGGFCGVVAGG
jgi:hypothetical protein